MARITIVDENDQPIGTKNREDITEKDIYRVSAIWITHPRTDILMAQRAKTKKTDPGRWGAAVTGTVEEGEDYFTNAVKEAVQEISLMVDPKKLHKGPLQRIKQSNRNFFCQWFFYTTDVPAEVLIPKENEVAQVRWLARDVVTKMVETQPEMLVEGAAQWTEGVLVQPQEE